MERTNVYKDHFNCICKNDYKQIISIKRLLKENNENKLNFYLEPINDITKEIKEEIITLALRGFPLKPAIQYYQKSDKIGIPHIILRSLVLNVLIDYLINPPENIAPYDLATVERYEIHIFDITSSFYTKEEIDYIEQNINKY